MFWLVGFFVVCMSTYQIMPFQIILPLGICASSKFIWANWIWPNKFSPSFPLQAFPLGWGKLTAELSHLWGTKEVAQQRQHILQKEQQPQLHVCHFSSVFSAEDAKHSQLLLPLSLPSSPTAFIPRPATNLSGEEGEGCSPVQSFLASCHFCPYSTPPGYLHFSSSTVSHNKAREGNKSILWYILVNMWVTVV